MVAQPQSTLSESSKSAAGPTARPVTYPKTRRIRFRFGEEAQAEKYFVNNDMAFSHFVANLSASFPTGEEGFIRSVRKFSDEITDPDLKKRVAGFIGQESVHGQEHRRVNDKLYEMGYIGEFLETDKFVARRIKFEDSLPPRLHLSMTAMMEHFTAILAEQVLGSEELQSIPGDPEIWHLLNWHALEELEHKSVAFDVYRAVGGTERMRIWTLRVFLALVVPMTFGLLGYSVLKDPVARRHPVRVLREAWNLFRGPMFRGMFPKVKEYLREGFHPDDLDTEALLTKWQQELFGDQGVLVDHLK